MRANNKTNWLEEKSKRFNTRQRMCVCVCDLRGVFSPLETLAVKAVVAESCEDAVNGLVHSLQAHGALWQLRQLHHRQTGSLRREEMTERKLFSLWDHKSAAFQSHTEALILLISLFVTAENIQRCWGSVGLRRPPWTVGVPFKHTLHSNRPAVNNYFHKKLIN